jgi:hypothetical protein
MAHTYTYHFYEAPDLQIATIEADAPIAHLSAGNQLLVEIDGYASKRGHHLEIQFIRVRMLRARKSSPLHFEVHVVCEERKQNPPL